VLDRLAGLLASQKDEREPVVRTGRRRLLLKHVPVRLGGLFHHADARVANGDLLQHDRIARRRLERETERCEGLMELAGPEHVEALLVVIDRAGDLVAQDLVPERHARVS